jgi:hypothetical protein
MRNFFQMKFMYDSWPLRGLAPASEVAGGHIIPFSIFKLADQPISWPANLCTGLNWSCHGTLIIKFTQPFPLASNYQAICTWQHCDESKLRNQLGNSKVTWQKRIFKGSFLIKLWRFEKSPYFHYNLHHPTLRLFLPSSSETLMCQTSTGLDVWQVVRRFCTLGLGG